MADQQQDAPPHQEETNNAFSQHVQEDPALMNGDAASPQQDEEGMSFVAKTLVYLGFPLLMGIAGLYVGYLKTISDQNAKIDFDTDFIFPFLLALALVVVISIQTRGFTRKKITPLVQWPKVRRRRKVIRKRVIVDDNGNQIEEIVQDKKND